MNELNSGLNYLRIIKNLSDFLFLNATLDF